MLHHRNTQTVFDGQQKKKSEKSGCIAIMLYTMLTYNFRRFRSDSVGGTPHCTPPNEGAQRSLPECTCLPMGRLDLLSGHMILVSALVGAVLGQFETRRSDPEMVAEVGC
jgi:hypothetical protein